WPSSVMSSMMETHITQTTTYAVDLLNGDYEASIENFDEARHHMMMFADILAEGIIRQFPNKFAR
ncbi:MAG TPA: hypothetical protein VJ935_06635, partial [Acidimicrobiia bacterium]|nr:hypothetical protein [Acidimicrobiia bacterium]